LGRSATRVKNKHEKNHAPSDGLQGIRNTVKGAIHNIKAIIINFILFMPFTTYSVDIKEQ